MKRIKSQPFPGIETEVYPADGRYCWELYIHEQLYAYGWEDTQDQAHEKAREEAYAFYEGEN